ncbi:MAG: hypothetical protein GC159_16320 [Phycisphaera sp.]|nr:hypothetical protein [Phycisphaera sp.]
MTEHGLIADGWRFAWSNGKRQLGRCQIRRRRDPSTGKYVEIKTIKLSRYLVALNNDHEVRDTILHEIAHAIAGLKNGHNSVWKAVCRRIGAKPQRLAGEHITVVKGRYVLLCGCCEKELARRHRRIRPEALARSYCRHCGPESKGTLKILDRPDAGP